MKGIDSAFSALWARLPKADGTRFPGGVALWTPEEREAYRNEALEDAARLAEGWGNDDSGDISDLIRELKRS